MRPAISINSSFGVKSTEVEAHAANAGGVQRLQLRIADAALHGGNAARSSACGAQRIDDGGIVRAMTCRLHDHVAREAEMIAQRKQLVLRGVARRVLALRRERKGVAGAEHVAVRIHRAFGQFEARL
jgi:hypothetical protein